MEKINICKGIFTPDTIEQMKGTIQAYYDQNGIDEKASVTIKEHKAMPVTVEVHTKQLLTYEHMVKVSNILWLLMPIGIMHELCNVILDDISNEQKESIREFITEDTNTSVAISGINESGNIVPLPLNKTKN